MGGRKGGSGGQRLEAKAYLDTGAGETVRVSSRREKHSPNIKHWSCTRPDTATAVVIRFGCSCSCPRGGVLALVVQQGGQAAASGHSHQPPATEQHRGSSKPSFDWAAARHRCGREKPGEKEGVRGARHILSGVRSACGATPRSRGMCHAGRRRRSKKGP